MPRSSFEPIAIVGRGCVLPGAHDPGTFWDNVVNGRDLTATATAGTWGTDPAPVLRPDAGPGRHAATAAGGFVTGFDPARGVARWNGIDGAGMDAVVHWLHAAAHDALAEAGRPAPPSGTGLIVGNLSYPTRGHADHVASVFAPGAAPTHPINRFSSGAPVHIAAAALGLTGPAYAIDAACASSLYAIKLACDALHDRRADLMLAGAVNRADMLFLHIGFTELRALSPSGRSRPFHREADGLLPAEGAGVVALRRLDDAVRDGDTVLGVIRGIGLSNDGRAGGFLSPDRNGEVRAMRAAQAAAGLGPRDIGYVECHATGTLTGDAVELAALSEVFADTAGLRIGSVKSNLGHLITAAGVAGLMKAVAALGTRTLPPTLHLDAPLPAFEGLPIAPQLRAEPWPDDLPLRAGVSAFGFGGNNAHLIVEPYDPDRALPPAATPTPRAPVVITAMALRAGAARDPATLLQSAAEPGPPVPLDEVVLPLKAVRLPPRDLQAALAQQTALIETTHEALCATRAGPAAEARGGVFMGMGCDSLVARSGLAWRHGMTEVAGVSIPALDAAGALGAMPNMPANRLNTLYDWRGMGFTIASEEASGNVALELAARALAGGEIDVALVGAADLSCEPAHEAAARALLPETRPGDAAVTLVLRREADALRDGDRIIARLAPPGEGDATPPELGGLGHAHAASGLVVLAHAATEVSAGLRAGAPSTDPARDLAIGTFTGQTVRHRLEAAGGTPTIAIPRDTPPVAVFHAGTDHAGLATALRDGLPGDGPMRLALTAPDTATLATRRESALAALDRGAWPSGPGTHCGEGPAGEVAAVFTGAAASYGGMGEGLFRAMPDVLHAVVARHPVLAGALTKPANPLTPPEQLAGGTLLAQVHAEALRRLGVVPDAALGLSSGETNALYATGVWRDMGEMLAEIDASGMYGPHLTGRCEAARTHYDIPAGEDFEWRSLQVRAPVGEVRAALEAEPRVRVIIVTGPADCVIGGEATAIDRVAARLSARTAALGQDMVAHHPALAPFEARWRAIHDRESHATPTRIYSNAHNGAYAPGRAAIADALTRQALDTVDFPRTVEAAYADGVRVFIEHGPRGALTAAIRDILGDRPHVAVALDRTTASLGAFVEAVAALHAAGVAIDPAPLLARLETLAPHRYHPDGPLLRLPAHPRKTGPEPTAPDEPETDVPQDRLVLPPAPALPAPARPAAATAGPAPAAAPAPVSPPPSPATHTARHAPATPTTPSAQAPTGAVTGHLPDAAFAVIDGVHRDFLARQHEAHAAFLAIQRDLFARLSEAAGGMTEAAPQTAPPPAGTIPSVSSVPPVPAPARTSPPSPPQTPSTVKAAPSPAQHGAPAATPLFDRAAVEELASGRISSVLGPEFAGQDRHLRQVRLPEPPLLFVDRVMELTGEPGGMGLGGTVTETDVPGDAWYLHAGRVRPGVVIEAGQADLLAISWLGVDAHLQGERVYRLLGCDITFHEGGLPKAGDTLRYTIRVDGHARTGDVRLFFFSYELHVGDRLVASTRNGQAGFFTHAELDDSLGVLWDAEDHTPKTPAVLDLPPCPTTRRSLDAAAVAAFAAGNAWRCFGPGFETAAAHRRTPNIPEGQMQLIDRVEVIDPTGGPWGRGYLRAVQEVPRDAWFYEGHFKNDPCMPGTLMADAATQAMSIMLAGLGFTLIRDGWRFEPAPDDPARFVCRGEVVPDRPHTLTYEIFVEEVIDGDHPTLFAAVLCSCDGFKVFHSPRFGVRLVPDVPTSSPEYALPEGIAPRLVHPEGDVRGDERAIAASAFGPAEEAFGSLYAGMETRRAPRLPGPPYQFMTRVMSASVPPGEAATDAECVADFDIDPDAWYFNENGAPVMPFCVLVEALLQPCGWLASYLGFATEGPDLCFRNLDGLECVQHRPVTPETGTLTSTVTLTRFARAGETSVLFFTVEAADANGPVMSLTTQFGFFGFATMANQKGLPVSDADRARRNEASDTFIDLTVEPPELFAERPVLGRRRLRVLDAITGYWPGGRAEGLGRIRGTRAVDPEAWYFRAHFFQDPVQPGSLGLESLLFLLQTFIKLEGLADGIPDPVFEPVALGVDQRWTYRGQVVPRNNEITADIDILSIERNGDSVTVSGRGSLWVDELRIYEVTPFAVRVVAGGAGDAPRALAPLDEAPVAAPVEVPRPDLSIPAIRAHWRRWTGLRDWPVEALQEAVTRRVLRDVTFDDWSALAPLRGKPVLFLANHQVAVETMVFSLVAAVALDRPVLSVAKAEHRESWLGRLATLCESFPGARQPGSLLFFDRSDPAALLAHFSQMGARLERDGASLMIHAEGTRAHAARQPVTRLSAAVTDLAVSLSLPVVPVRFSGALPIEAAPQKLDFPVGHGGISIHFGRPVPGDQLAALPSGARRDLVAEAINGAGPPLAGEAPFAPDPAFAARVETLATRFDLPPQQASLLAALDDDAALMRDLAPMLDGGAPPPPEDGEIARWYRMLRAWAQGRPLTDRGR